MIFLAALALQLSSLGNIPQLEQASQAAAQSSNECFTSVANAWWSLPDDARAIADAAVYGCDDELEAEAMAFHRLLLARLMAEKSSTAGLEQAMAAHRNDFRERSRLGVEAIVLKKRFFAAKSQNGR